MIYFVTGRNELFENSHYKCISVEESLSLLSELSVVGLDTETEGFDPYTKRLLSLQLGNRDFQVVIDATTVNVRQYKEFLESDRVFLGWNLKFDLRFLFMQGIYPRRVYDGYLAEKLLWLGYPPGMHEMSLKAAGKHYLDVELDKTVRGKILYEGLTTEVIVYGANDVRYLEDILRKQHAELQKKGLAEAIKVENKFVLPLAYMEHCGVKLDETKWKAKMDDDNRKYHSALEALDKWVVGHFPNDRRFSRVDLQGDLWSGFNTEPQCCINWNSPSQVAALFKELGFDLSTQDKETGGVKDSIDAKVIEPQKHISDIAPIYLEYKAAAKVVGTYGQNFLDQINPVSRRIHTSFQQMGADTTRITSGGKDKSNRLEYVNLLNLPSDAATRSCFVAEKGNRWISIDYSGQETYLMASIANDQAIIKELTEGSGDIHSLTAYMSYKEIPRDLPITEIKKFSKKSAENGGLDYRQEAKGIEFAINYGGDANTIHQNKGIPLEEAQKIYNSYMEGFKGLQKYQSFRRRDWFEKGYILLSPITGHKAFIYDYDSLLEDKERMSEEGFWEYYREMKQSSPSCATVQMVKHFFKRKSASEKQSINYPIQAAGSMCLRYAMYYLWEYIIGNDLQEKVKICVTPYDEINAEAPEDIAEQVALKIHDCMVKAGAIFCTRCKLDADISRNKDGSLPDHWIH